MDEAEKNDAALLVSPTTARQWRKSVKYNPGGENGLGMRSGVDGARAHPGDPVRLRHSEKWTGPHARVSDGVEPYIT